MFAEIFFPRTAERYRTAPIVEQRERYLVHLRETGAKQSTLRKCANDQLSLVRLLNLREGSRVRPSQIEAVTTIWSQPKERRCDRSASSKSRARFVSRGIHWLRFSEATHLKARDLQIERRNGGHPCLAEAASVQCPAAPGPDSGPLSRTNIDRPGVLRTSPTVQ